MEPKSSPLIHSCFRSLLGLPMLLLSHRYIKGFISDNQDEKCWSYSKNWLHYWHFLRRNNFQEKKIYFPFMRKIAKTQPKMKILSSVFFCKYPVFIAQKGSSIKIGCYWGSRGSLFIFSGSWIFLGGVLGGYPPKTIEI